ncbi:hypothetical protein MIND_01263300 [Mycena indigotica]|uniref:Uncharacterized protein n=1 Tax=Mycena indigotica TaxID=2126181 RepID=A0A8H6S1I2_9AGAR|nr:uncharacterized protein MIND_01263300 [Mycena indigotica]KAF7291199.1 hypothetical protein MIND_01263300 [Mycena indigotica]
MVFEEADNAVDKDGNSLTGLPKGMEQVLRERNMLPALETAASKREVGSWTLKQKLNEKAMSRLSMEIQTQSLSLTTNSVQATAACDGLLSVNPTSRLKSRCSRF